MIFIGKIYADPYVFLCKKHSFSNQEHIEIVKKISRSSKWNDALYHRYSQNGQDYIYVSMECLIWYCEVKTKKGNPKDLQISFLEKYIEELETYLEIPHEQKEYVDLPLKYLRTYFNKTKNAIGVATNRMQKHFPYPLKYIKNGCVYVSSIGIKWLNEKYFRTKYIEELKNYKDSLEKRIPN